MIIGLRGSESMTHHSISHDSIMTDDYDDAACAMPMRPMRMAMPGAIRRDSESELEPEPRRVPPPPGAAPADASLPDGSPSWPWLHPLIVARGNNGGHCCTIN